MTEQKATFRSLAKKAKRRMKSGFWSECKQDVTRQVELAKAQGLNESKAERFFIEKVTRRIAGEKQDDFYERVTAMLIENGEVSDAIGRLTDKAYYDTLSYEEKQRYTLSLSEKYLRALERFRKECEFVSLHENA
jgi:hypothetical protein